jgi:hypothetical protein
MNIIKLFIFCVLSILLISCNDKINSVDSETQTKENSDFKISSKKTSKEDLPNEITFEGNLKELVKLKDLMGEHIIILTETGEIPSANIIDHDEETDFKIYAYDFILDKNENKYKLNWKIQDFISNCEFDLIMGFVKNTFKITDLNKNGIAEIWTMYKMTCTSDVSPSDLKIIMYEGQKKYAIRGENKVLYGIDDDGKKLYMGGEYKIDKSFSDGPNEFLEFAEKMWKENIDQKYD